MADQLSLMIPTRIRKDDLLMTARWSLRNGGLTCTHYNAAFSLGF